MIRRGKGFTSSTVSQFFPELTCRGQASLLKSSNVCILRGSATRHPGLQVTRFNCVYFIFQKAPDQATLLCPSYHVQNGLINQSLTHMLSVAAGACLLSAEEAKRLLGSETQLLQHTINRSSGLFVMNKKRASVSNPWEFQF